MTLRRTAIGVSALVVAGAARCALFPSLDSLSPADAAGDAIADARAEAALCDGVDAAVCTDFDHGPLLSGGWSGSMVENANLLGIDDAGAYSTPSSLFGVIGDAGGTARVYVQLSPSVSRVHVRARLFVPPLDAVTDYVDPLEVLCNTGDDAGDFTGFWLRLTSSTQVVSAGNGGAQTFQVSIPTSAWTLFDLDAHYTDDGGMPSRLAVTVDGVVQVDVATPEVRCPSPDFQVNTGLSARQPFSVRVDDVIVQVE